MNTGNTGILSDGAWGFSLRFISAAFSGLESST
jgi:hypothetical protein